MVKLHNLIRKRLKQNVYYQLRPAKIKTLVVTVSWIMNARAQSVMRENAKEVKLMLTVMIMQIVLLKPIATCLVFGPINLFAPHTEMKVTHVSRIISVH